MQYDGQWLRDRRHGTGTLTIESAGGAATRTHAVYQSRYRVSCSCLADPGPQVLYTYDGQWVAESSLQLTGFYRSPPSKFRDSAP